MRNLRPAIVIACCLLPGPLGAEVIEAFGAERCGGDLRRYAVEFLAPEDAPVEARAKIMRDSGEDEATVPSLSLDGAACSDGRCGFRASKGRTYQLVASSAGRGRAQLCVTISRP